MPNELTFGTRRVGDFVDFDPNTPEVKVVLEHSERGIGVTVPWSNDEDPYAYWFLSDSSVIRVPPRPKGPKAPKRVLFHDSHGSVLLIGCRARGFHSNLFGPGSGTLWARAAILGVSENVDFDQPHGLQSSISGLRAWLDTSSWKETHDYNRRPMKISVQSLDIPDIEVGAHHGIRLALSFGYGTWHEEDGDRRILTDYAHCVTRSATPETWTTHLKLHSAVRDLLVLSRWHQESCHEVYALHLKDPLRTIDGETHGEQWRNVVVADAETKSAPKGPREHLFKYNELGTAGLLRWITLRDEFARALDPVISSIELRGTTPNTLLAHTGPGLEALGYLLMLRDGVPKAHAKGTPLKERLERILADLDDCLPFESDEWVRSTCATYNGLKHANRQEPDSVHVMNAWRECVLVTRAWLAAELDIPHEKIKERLANDPQRHAYVKVE